MKKIIAIALALLMVLSFAACGAKENVNTENDASLSQGDVQASVDEQPSDTGAAVGTQWPSNTIFPQPEGCKIIEVKSESYKNYITVEWDSKDAAKQYIEVVKAVEGDSAEVISQGETDDTIYYGTYNITITSMNEAENIVLYK